MKDSIKRAIQSPSFRGGLFYAALWSVFGILGPFMNLELSRRGFSGLEIGTIGSVRGIVILVSASVFARIADRKNIRVKMMQSFMIFAAVGVTLFGFPKTFPWLIAATILMAVWQGPLDSLGNSVVVRMANRYRVDYGMMTFWGAVAFAAMNLVGGIVWEQVGFRWIYLSAGILYLVVSFIAGGLEEPQADTTEATKDLPDESQSKKPLKPSIIVFLVGYFVFSLAFFNAFGFTGPILDLRGASEFVIGLVGTVIGVGGMIVRHTNQKILNRISIQSAMIIGIVMGVIPILVYGWVANVNILLISSIFRGAGWGMFSLCAVRYIDQQASVENASTLQSSLIILSTLANIISSTVSGFLYDTNPTLIFLSSTIICLVSLVIIVVVRQMDRHEEKELISETLTSAG